MLIVDRTTFEPMVARSPQSMFAASALGALATGFAAAAAAQVAGSGKRSAFARVNALVAVGCAALALGFRLRAQPKPTAGSALATPLVDRNEAPSLDYSIIIPVYNRPDDMRTLLTSLFEISASCEHVGRGEIVIVNDGSTDTTVDVVENLALQSPIPLRVISKPNGGVSSARNTGFASARGRVGIVIDSDCIPESTWLESMLKAAQSDRRLLVFARIRSGKRPAYPLENLPDVKGFVGASFAINKIAYLELGGCYEKYGASHDDRDLVLTALAQNFEVAHAEAGWIFHPLRRETLRSMWRVGLNSRFGNLFALRHGVYATRGTQPTPYYFFGIGSNYGSSIAFVVVAFNALLTIYTLFEQRKERGSLLKGVRSATVIVTSAYIGSLVMLGLLTRARPRDLPNYVATLATFQFATMIGRLRGSLEYGIFLL